jgi:polysaccharide chain length determinant protein (PEP-CTERM system associated)
MLGHRALNVEDYLSILKRRWWIIAIPAIIAPIISVGVTFFLRPQYQSQTLILIDQQKVSSDFVKSVVTEDLSNRLATIQTSLLSRSTLQPIVEKFNLYADERLTMDGRIDEARKNTRLEAIQSNVARANGLPGFRIYFIADDPHTAQQVCAEITSLFTAANLRGRTDTAQGTNDFLKEQLDNAKHNLDDQDAKLATFQGQHFGSLPGDEAGNTNMLTSLNSQLEAATQSLQQMEQSQSVMEAMLAQQAQSNSTGGGAGASPAASPQAQQKQLDDLQALEADLSLHYTADYPDLKQVRRKIADLQKQMEKEAAAPPAAATAAPPPVINRPDPVAVQSLRAQLRGVALAIQAKRKQQDQIEGQIRSYQGRLQSSPQVNEEYKQLTRDYQTAQTFYDGLLAKFKQSQMATDLENRQQGETFSVLDPSNFPDSPIWPKRSVFGLGGLAGGMAFGVLIIGLLEYRDTALRSERDVWAFTQLPTLAIIAWSGSMDNPKNGGWTRLKRLFSRKKAKNQLVDAPG